MKHTQGPWSVGQYNGAEMPSVYAYPENVRICTLDHWVGSGVEEMEANATLIAAAPDLLKSLQECTDELEASGYCFDHPSLVKYRAAIAKATE